MPFFQSNEDRSINYFTNFDMKSFQENYKVVLDFLNEMTSLSQRFVRPGVLVQCSTCNRKTNIKNVKKDVHIYVSDHVECKHEIDELKTTQGNLEASLQRACGQTTEGSDVDNAKMSCEGLKHRLESEGLHNEIQQLKERNNGLTKKLEESEKTIETLRDDIKQFQNEINDERLNMATTQSKWSSDIEDKCREVEKLSRARESMISEITQLNNRIIELVEQKDQLKTQYEFKFAAMDSENRDLHLKGVNLENELKRMAEKEEYLIGEVRALQIIIDEERSDSHNTIDVLENKVKELEKTIREYEEKRKKFLTVNVHTSLKDSLSQPAQRHIENCLREKLSAEKIGLEVRRYASPDVTPGPVLVLCMNVSRLGTDVKEAMKGTPGNQDVIIVVLHHKEVHALPSQSSDRVLTAEEYKHLGAIVDAAFWSGKGMYPCTLNTLAIDKIFDFLLRFAN